jgi:cytochrome b561
MKRSHYSIAYRLLHWSIAIAFLLLLGTIFLRLTWLNRESVADIIQNYLLSIQVILTREQIVLLAKKIRKPMWDWHIYLGYVITGLFTIRMLLPFFGEMKFVNPFTSTFQIREKFQFWVYYIFYLCVAGSLVTGLLIEHGPSYMKKPLEEIHEYSLYYLLGFIVLHFVGVLYAEFTHDKGIVSKIVRGSLDS